jgi:hypothetical protein
MSLSAVAACSALQNPDFSNMLRSSLPLRAGARIDRKLLYIAAGPQTGTPIGDFIL